MNTVLITGASSGYGLETARHFHGQGWQVVATMRKPRAGLLREAIRILALDVTDPASIAERWGRAVLHCPYCHCYELDRGRIAVIATGPMSIHQAQLLPEWEEITFLTNGAVTLDPDQRTDLHRRGVMIEETPIRRISGDADAHLDDGRVLTFVGLFTASRTEPASPLGEAAGCALIETPLGRQIQTADSKETSIPGLFACGDVARAPHSVSLAVADGAWAGAQLHRSLV